MTTPTDFVTDDAGRIAFQGTAGTYTVTSESEQATVDVNLGPARSALEVTLNA